MTTDHNSSGHKQDTESAATVDNRVHGSVTGAVVQAGVVHQLSMTETTIGHASGVQVGKGNTQIIYTYNNAGTWTDGVAPPPLVDLSGTIESPYRGLAAYEERDAPFFFGREAATSDLLERMSQRLPDSGLLVVSGASGAGKSSLVRAGILPRIRGTGLLAVPDSTSWPCLVLTPGRTPLEELAVRVAPVARADAASIHHNLVQDPTRFALTAAQAALSGPVSPADDPPVAGTPQRRLLLVVDQFEQLFIHCPDQDQRRAFIAALHAAATTGHGSQQTPAALVVLVVRADFEARCADYPQLTAAIQDRYLVTSMTSRQLRMAITEPAKTAGSYVEDDLVDLLLTEMRTPAGAPSPDTGLDEQPLSHAGVLPLLSHALDQAWRHRTGPHLTIADYERTGGIDGAVTDSAYRAYDRLTPAQQAVARRVFIRLTATNTEGVNTADRAPRSELTASTNADAQAREVDAVLIFCRNCVPG